MINPGDFLSAVGAELTDELVEVLQKGKAFRLERIVSQGHSSPDGFWYDQDEHEWVMVLQGEAQLELANQAGIIHLTPGQYVNLPAHCRHRVAWTSPSSETIWLALFYTT